MSQMLLKLLLLLIKMLPKGQINEFSSVICVSDKAYELS